MAQIGGVTRNTQGSYERDERRPDTGYLKALNAVGLDILYVVTGVPTPQVVYGATAAEDNLVNQYRALPEADQATVDRILGAMWQQSSKGKE